MGVGLFHLSAHHAVLQLRMLEALPWDWSNYSVVPPPICTIVLALAQSQKTLFCVHNIFPLTSKTFGCCNVAPPFPEFQSSCMLKLE